MDFDTGSSDIWVPSVDCARCGDHPLFDAEDSSTFKSGGNMTWSLRYGDGSGVYGVTGYDTIHLGNGLSEPGQLIGLVEAETFDFTMDPNLDGIFGLGFPPLSLTGQNVSIVQAMKDEGRIPSAQVGVYLGRARDGGKGEIVSIVKRKTNQLPCLSCVYRQRFLVARIQSITKANSNM